LLLSGGLFDAPQKNKTIAELETLMEEPGFWDDVKKANEINSRVAALKKEINLFTTFEERLNNAKEMLNLLETENDENLFKELETDLNSFAEEIKELETTTLLSGEYDNLNCYLEINPGAGGTESCDWASMLQNMYQNFCNKKGFTYDVTFEQAGEEAGIKSCTLLIKGLNAYGYLRTENGVHRLVRISPFDSNKRRHTSFASVIITPEFDEKVEIEIKESDLKIDVYRSSGAGGQSVNTTDSAVRITHLPTKIVVTCQNERSQIQNKAQAMNILKSKLYQLELEKQKEKVEKIQNKNVDINFGSQIRSYVLEPYKMVKDHRTNYETSNADAVLNGDIEAILENNLRIL